MNEEIKDKIYKIILKEYANHCKIARSKRPLWHKRLSDLGINLFSEKPLPEEYISISFAAFGQFQIPIEVAEKILVLGGFP